MAKITFDIPDKQLEEAAKDRIKELERLLKNALNREDKLKAKLQEYKDYIEVNNDAVEIIKDILGKVRYVHQYQDYFWGVNEDDL